MVNIPEWERLADATKRVMLSGLTESEAQLALCRAIANRQIRVRIYLGKFESGDFFLGAGVGVDVGLIIPPQLDRQDFDWAQSSPRKPWRGPAGIGSIFPDWRHDRVEVFSADVTKVLCGSEQAPGAHSGCIERCETPTVPMQENGEQKPLKRKRRTEVQRQTVAPRGSGLQEYAPNRPMAIRNWRALRESFYRGL